MRATLRQLHVYPIKSLRGVPLQRARVTQSGLELDRAWMIVDASGRCLTQIEEPRMALIDVAFEDDALRVDASGMPSLRIPLRESGVPRRDVKLFRRRRYGVPVSDAADRWFATVLGVRCSLVQMRAQDAVTFANERPLHLITEASVAELNADVEGDAVPSGRFRPNFVVAGPSPYQEDRWTEVRIGSVAFRRVEPTSRCAVTTVDSRTGTRGVEPLRTLGRTRSAITLRGRKLHFGQYLTLDGMGGEVHLGDEVRA